MSSVCVTVCGYACVRVCIIETVGSEHTQPLAMGMMHARTYSKAAHVATRAPQHQHDGCVALSQHAERQVPSGGKT